MMYRKPDLSERKDLHGNSCTYFIIHSPFDHILPYLCPLCKTQLSKLKCRHCGLDFSKMALPLIREVTKDG